MDRREFINKSGIGVAALGINFSWLNMPEIMNEKAEFKAMNLSFKLHSDGSYDIISGEMSLKECYPVFDEKQVRPLHINVVDEGQSGNIRYDLAEGSIIIYLKTDNNLLSISSELLGFSRAPHWFMPLGFGKIEGSDRFYKQGFGFAGPSGVFPFPENKLKMEGDYLKEEAFSYDSYLVSGLLSQDSHTLAWTVNDHEDFLNRSTFYNRYHRFGLIDRHLHIDNNYVDCGFSLEKIVLARDIQKLPSINFIAGDSPYPTFRELMKNLANANSVQLKKPRYHWCSWYEYEKEFSYELLRSLLSGLKEVKPKLPLQTIQIDDGYSYYGDWLNGNNKWPGGMQPAASLIERNGFIPGIWVGPFMVSSKSEIFQKNKEWLLKDKQGNIILESKREDETLHVLDTSHPGAFDYLRRVFRTFKSQGYKYFKTDFLDWGFRDSTMVTRFTPGKTSARYFTEVMEMIREEIGKDVFWLACIAPYQPLIGYADAVRVSNDVHPSWAGGGIINMFREMHFGQIFNNLLWQNDPDVVYLRTENSKLTEEEKYSIAFFNGITGGVINTSDRLHTLNEFEKSVWRMLNPGDINVTAEIYNWEQFGKVLKLSRKVNDNIFAWLAVNISEAIVEVDMDFNKIFNIANPDLHMWKNNEGFVPVTYTNNLRLKLKAHESVLFYVGKLKIKKPGQISLAGIKIEN